MLVNVDWSEWKAHVCSFFDALSVHRRDELAAIESDDSCGAHFDILTWVVAISRLAINVIQ